MPEVQGLPEFARWINPLLRVLRELGGSARPREVVERVARDQNVPDSVLDQLNPAGGQRFPNQVHWARYYLAEYGYIDRSRHGVWKLTEVGSSVTELTQVQLVELVESVQHKVRSIAAVRVEPAGNDQVMPAVEPGPESDSTPPEVEAGVDRSSDAPPFWLNPSPRKSAQAAIQRCESARPAE